MQVTWEDGRDIRWCGKHRGGQDCDLMAHGQDCDALDSAGLDARADGRFDSLTPQRLLSGGSPRRRLSPGTWLAAGCRGRLLGVP